MAAHRQRTSLSQSKKTATLCRLFFSVFLIFLFASCTFPTRMGYDRKTGSYKHVPVAASTPSSKKQVQSKAPEKPVAKANTQANTKDSVKVVKESQLTKVNPAKQPAPKVSTATPQKPHKSKKGKKFSTLREYTDSWNGTRYVYGGSSRQGTDCSGYIMNIFRDFYGVELPHKASTIYEDNRFEKVSRSDLKEGDLVFFGDFWGISHIGIYLGDDSFSHASTSKGVMVSKLSEKYFDSRYKGARRFKRN